MFMIRIFVQKKFWVGIGITIIALYLSLMDVEWIAFLNALSRVRYGYVIPTLLLVAVSYWFRAYRWSVLLTLIKSIPMRSVAATTMVGFMINNILPARLGELYRAYAIGKKEHISKTASFATIVVERVFDVFTLLLFLAFVARGSVLPEWANQTSWLIFLGTLALFAVLISMVYVPRAYFKIYDTCALILPIRVREKLRGMLSAFMEGLAMLKNMRTVIWVAILSLLVWSPMAAMNYFVLYAFSYDVPILAGFAVLVITAIGVMIPSAPGYVGTFQLFTIFALSPYGISKSEALGVSLVLHTVEYLPVTLAGLWYFAKQHLNLRTLYIR